MFLGIQTTNLPWPATPTSPNAGLVMITAAVLVALAFAIIYHSRHHTTQAKSQLLQALLTFFKLSLSPPEKIKQSQTKPTKKSDLDHADEETDPSSLENQQQNSSTEKCLDPKSSLLGNPTLKSTIARSNLKNRQCGVQSTLLLTISEEDLTHAITTTQENHPEIIPFPARKARPAQSLARPPCASPRRQLPPINLAVTRVLANTMDKHWNDSEFTEVRTGWCKSARSFSKLGPVGREAYLTVRADQQRRMIQARAEQARQAERHWQHVWAASSPCDRFWR